MNDVAAGGLGELTPAVGPSDQQQIQITDKWNTYTYIEDYIRYLGVEQLKMPMVAMPIVTVETLRGLNDDQYMEVYNAHDAWNSYIGETISQTMNIILQIENEMDDLDVHITEQIKEAAKHDGKKPSVEDIKFTVRSHYRTRQLKHELQRQQQILNRLTARQKTLSRAEKLLSRNIELIKSARESGNGGGGIQKRGSQGLPPRFT